MAESTPQSTPADYKRHILGAYFAVNLLLQETASFPLLLSSRNRTCNRPALHRRCKARRVTVQGSYITPTDVTQQKG